MSGRGIREKDWAVALGVEAVRLGEHSGGCGPPWCGAPRLQCAAAVPLPPFFHPHPAARPGTRKVPENEKGGGPRPARGGPCFLLFGPVVWKNLKWATPPRVLASGCRERAPRIAAATTCSPHVASGRSGAAGRSLSEPLG